MTFENKLYYGKVGESYIASWFKQKGYTILPVYDTEKNSGKGPVLYLPTMPLIAPDMLIFKGQKIYWIEAKHKTAFSWHRITKRWVTGIDLRHYLDYLKVDDSTPFPVWLVFLQEGGGAKDSPSNSPSGLYGNSLSYLRKNENHRHENWGKSGMVYWAINNLIKLSDTQPQKQFKQAA